MLKPALMFITAALVVGLSSNTFGIDDRGDTLNRKVKTFAEQKIDVAVKIIQAKTALSSAKRLLDRVGPFLMEHEFKSASDALKNAQEDITKADEKLGQAALSGATAKRFVRDALGIRLEIAEAKQDGAPQEIIDELEQDYQRAITLAQIALEFARGHLGDAEGFADSANQHIGIALAIMMPRSGM